MPIDSSIYNMVGKFPQIEVPDPLERQTRLAQLKQLAMQGEMGQMQLGEAKAKQAKVARVNSLLSQHGGDVQKAAQAAKESGDYETANELGSMVKNQMQTDAIYQKSVSEAREAFLKASKEERAAVQAGLEDLAKGIQWVEQGNPEELPARYAKFVQAYPPQVREKYGMGPQYDPMTSELITTRAQAWGEARKVSEREKFEETRRHNLAVEKKSSGAVNINFGAMKPGEAGFDDAVEATKKKLLTGQMPFPKGRELSDPVNNKAVRLARIDDPSFNEATHQERAKAWSNLSNGPIGKSNNAINTAIAHLGKLTDLYKELSDTGVVGLNHTMNWLKKNAPGGYPALDEAETVINAVGDELEKAYTGTGTEGGRKAWREKLDPSLPMASRMRNAIGLIDLLEGKIKANSSQFKKAFGGMDPGISVLTPESEETLEKIKTWAKGKTASPSGKSNPQPDKPAAQAKILSEAEIGKLPPAVASAYKSGKAIKGPDGTVYKKGE